MLIQLKIDRERRLRAANNSSSNNNNNNNNNSTSSYDRDSRNNHSSNNNYSSSRDNNNDRSERGTPRSGKPAWMDEDSNSKDSAPAWMDAPASGVGGGEGLTFGSTTGRGGLDGSGAGGDGLDGIQAFKAQMKEMERREKEAASGGFHRKEEATPLVSIKASVPQESISSTDSNDVFIPPPSNKDSRSSVFDNLGLGTGISATTSLPNSGQQVAGSARGSRFAKFFDGKPPVAQQTSAFEGLLGGNKGGEAPSQEGRDSMARLMGMLQVSGVSLTSVVFPFSKLTLSYLNRLEPQLLLLLRSLLQ